MNTIQKMTVIKSVIRKCGYFLYRRLFIAASKMKLEDLATSVEKKIQLLEQADSKAISMAETAYRTSNEQLKAKIAILKKSLIGLELQAGAIQFSIPEIKSKSVLVSQQVEIKQETINVEAKPILTKTTSPTEGNKPMVSNPTKSGKEGGGKAPAASENQAIDVSRLDMRVGRIVEVDKHPDADSLYVEKVDLGEGRLRTIVSGLVRNVPIERMQNLTGIFMCNLKPAKMRGVESQGMLMCATSIDKSTVEPLVIEGDNVAIGDVVVVEGYPGKPDDQLNPKKKIFEQVKPDLLVANHIATYKGAAWKLKGKPDVVIKAPSIASAQIS